MDSISTGEEWRFWLLWKWMRIMLSYSSFWSMHTNLDRVFALTFSMFSHVEICHLSDRLSEVVDRLMYKSLL